MCQIELIKVPQDGIGVVALVDISGIDITKNDEMWG